MHQITKFKWFSSRLAIVSAQFIEARCYVENEDVVGVVPIGDAPTTSVWSTILLHTQVRLILQVWWYVQVLGYQPIECWSTHWPVEDLNGILYQLVIFKLILVMDGWSISQYVTDDKSALVQIMAWCHQATSHYLSQCWPIFMSPYFATRPQEINKL